MPKKGWKKNAEGVFVAPDIDGVVRNVTTVAVAEKTVAPVVQEKKPDVNKGLEPLAEGQRYFESPCGTVLIGDAVASQLWWHKGNGGRGMWINPRRG